MSAPRWVPTPLLLAIHSDQIREHGGSPGLRDEGLLASALERAPNRFRYAPESDLAALAAAYGYGIGRNHPFIDGNKRMAFLAMEISLGLNGNRIVADEEAVVQVMLTLAAGELPEDKLAAWLRSHMEPR